MARRRGHGEGAIYQRESDGRWCTSVDLGIIGGKRKRKVIYGKTRKEVAEKLKALHREQAAGVNIAPQQQTLQHFLEQWLEQTIKRRNRLPTYKRYKQDVDLHIVPLLGRHYLTKLTPEHVQTMLNHLADQGLSYRSIRNVRAALRCALNQAMRYGHVVRNVATLVDIPGSVTFSIQPLDHDQAQQFLNTVKDHRFAALYRIAFGLGLRRGEILALRWRDVDFAAATLQINGSMQRQNGHLERTATKTTGSVRTLALPPKLLTMLQRHKVRQDALRQTSVTWKDSGMVFTSTIGTPLAPETLIEHFKASLKRAGLPTTTRFHDLRHSCATFMIKQNVHPRVVMDVLGHSQIATTMNTYAHVLAEVQRDAVSEVDALFQDDDADSAACAEGHDDA